MFLGKNNVGLYNIKIFTVLTNTIATCMNNMQKTIDNLGL